MVETKRARDTLELKMAAVGLVTGVRHEAL
jgi:hypothetical protein